MLGIIILAAYAALMIGVTLIFTRRATNAESFHVADRRIGSAVAAMSIAATWIWAPSLFTSSEMAYTRGIPGMFWFTVPNVLCLILFIPFARKIREQYPEGITLTGYMNERYRSGKVKGIYSFQLGALSVLSTAVQLLAGGKTLALLTGLPFWSMTLALAAIAYSYSRFSGLKAAIATDIVQLGIILLGGGLLVAAGKPTATKHEMTELLYNLLFVDEVIALLTTAVGFVTLPALLRLINTPAEILDTAVLYGRIYLMGLPFLMPYDLSKECVMGCGDSKTPLKVIVATSAMNIVLDLVLVGPFGVAGAAAATAAAQVAGAVYMVAFLRRTQMDAAFSLRMLKARYARDIFRLSAPNSVQQASGTIITTVKQGLLGGLGVEAIAGFSCAGKLSSLLMMPVFGFVQSTVFFIAQNTAALQPGRVKEGLREGRRILLVYSLGVVAVCIGLRGPLLRLFTTDPAAASYGCTMLAFESVTCLFVAQKHLFEARLRGAQKMGLYLASNLGQIALNLLACVILVPRIGFAGFWMSSWISAPIGMLLAAVLANLSGTSHQLP